MDSFCSKGKNRIDRKALEQRLDMLSNTLTVTPNFDQLKSFDNFFDLMSSMERWDFDEVAGYCESYSPTMGCDPEEMLDLLLWVKDNI